RGTAMKMTSALVLLLTLLAGLCSAQQQQSTGQQQSRCSFQSMRTPYTLTWVVDPTSQNIFFNLTYRNFPQGSFTGVGFGDNMNAGLDVILVSLPQGATTPQVIDASVKGYTQPTRDSNQEVQTRSASWISGTLSAQFIRSLTAPNSVDKALSGCVTWNFISSPGPAYANATYSKHSAAPEQQQQCNIATNCQGSIPSQFINTPNNGAWSGNGQNPQNNQQFYSPNQQQQYSNQQQQQQQQYRQQMNTMPYNNQQYIQPSYPNSQQYNQQPFQTQQFPQQQPYQNQQQFNQQPYQQYPQSNQIGSGAGMQQQQPFYNPYNNQNTNSAQQYGRRKRQANSNIYGYNYDSNEGSSPLLVQNPNYQFISNSLADQYARTYSQAAAQYDATNGGVNGAQRDPSFNQATQPPVLNNQQQNQQNFQQIQRDYASGAISTFAPATNIYGYNYNTPSTSGLTSAQLSPSSSSSAVSNRQFDSPSNRATNSVSQRDQSLQRFYNPGVSSNVGNVFTGSLYNGGQGTSGVNGSPGFAGAGPNSNAVFYNPSTSGSSSSVNGQFFDPTGNSGNNNGGFIASANRGPQPGQIVYYDTQNVGRKKRSAESPIRARRQVRFFDPGNNQSAMYYPYRTETDFNLNAGQAGFSQVGGSPQYSAPVINGVNGGSPGTQRYYDTSRGIYVDSVPQFDSRGGNQYLKTAPVNPQSPNFMQTLQNNARALNDYVDPSCSNQDPYWCQSYVAQIMQAQNSFGSYTSGLCNTLVASLQYSDNRCCNAVRAAGCQS
ncbi:hypothetical protein PENTCL1PPCAC_29118, partial [Pristionchus entomophagus]